METVWDKSIDEKGFELLGSDIQKMNIWFIKWNHFNAGKKPHAEFGFERYWRS